MTVDCQWLLQVAMRDAMAARSELTTLLASGATGVRYSVPEGQRVAHPHVVMGEHSTVPWDTKTEDGQEHTVMVHSWSDDPSRKELQLIMAQVHAALDKVALSVTGHDVVRVEIEFSETLLDEDGITYHGVQRFKVWTEEQ